MFSFHSFFKGFSNLIKSISKKTYRTCAIIITSMLIVLVISLASKDFGGSGKNRMVTSESTSETIESEYEDEESAAMANNKTSEADIEEVTVQTTLETASVVATETTTETTASAIPSGCGVVVSEQDYTVLCQIVQAEAGGEDDKGKLLVANVVLNRVKSDEFPDTITDVVYDTRYGVAQFQPTTKRSLDSYEVSESTKASVDRALSGENYSQGALYFAVETSSDSWFNTELTFLFQYCGHCFYK